MEDYLSFRKMITPTLIQVFFWIGIVVVVLMAVALMFSHSIGGFAMGVFYLVLGPIGVRVYCEIIMLFFKIFEEVKALREGLVPTPPTGFSIVPPVPGMMPPPPPPVAG